VGPVGQYARDVERAPSSAVEFIAREFGEKRLASYIYIKLLIMRSIYLSISLGVPPHFSTDSTALHKNDSTPLWNYLRSSERVYTPENRRVSPVEWCNSSA